MNLLQIIIFLLISKLQNDLNNFRSLFYSIPIFLSFFFLLFHFVINTKNINLQKRLSHRDIKALYNVVLSLDHFKTIKR
jgi:ATP/ADP translocase